MKLKSGFVLKEIGGQYMVLPVGAQTVDFNRMITLNETGAFLWKLLETEQTVETLQAAMLSEYDVDEKIALADIEIFLGNMQKDGLLEE